jgi:hypothetical protein
LVRNRILYRRNPNQRSLPPGEKSIAVRALPGPS